MADWEELMMLRKALVSIAFSWVFVAAAPWAAMAQEGVQEGGWKTTLSPFFWGTGLKGKTIIGQTEQDIDADFGDILDDLEMGAMVDVRFELERCAIQSNLVWAALESDTDTAGIHVEVEPNLVIFELNGRYRLTDNWELLGGIRYYDLDVDINASGAATFSTSVGKSWVDPNIGIVFSVPLSDRWSFKARGDIGGIIVGSDLSWQFWGLFDYRFGESSSVVFGWRHLDWDYKTSEGLSRFEMDTYMTGPVIGVRFRF
jgi:hypothetical protein